MKLDHLTKDAVLRVGEVSEVNGRRVFIKVDKNKNLSDVFLEGDILRNISVNSFIEIRKGFLTLIGKVDGERIEEEAEYPDGGYKRINKNRRYLTVTLAGFINNKGKFIAGTKELPLIGNEAYIVTRDKIHLIHNLVDEGIPSIVIATTDSDDVDIAFPIDGLFNTHIAIFGNTGSGKSNTLAYLYRELITTLETRNSQEFNNKSHFLLFDFNGEYTGEECISQNKKVFNLSTRSDNGDKLPLEEASFLDLEFLSILSDASEKTQKPFLKRVLNFYRHVYETDNPENYFINICKKRIEQILQMADKVQAFLLLDYLRELLPKTYQDGQPFDVFDGLDWHGSGFKSRNTNTWFSASPEQIPNTAVYQQADRFTFNDNLLTRIISFLYLQLISDVLSNRAQNEHIAPAVNKLRSKQADIEKIFDTSGTANFWEHNFVVANLHEVNLDMKKTIPLLLSKKLYSDHKELQNSGALNIIIDEAHNILSRESFREAENWKDYRLETFEEIIKEGRKFGVFMTISSQRPSDISHTITSQAHNYFIHRLINQKDLAMISNAVSYIDKVTEESIPTLPTGTCIFSGIASHMPLKVNVKPLDKKQQPRSNTLKFSEIIPISSE